MKIDMTTYTDKENQIGLTADHTSRPDKVLFFADPHFLFKTNPHWQVAQANVQTKTCQREQFCQRLKKNFLFAKYLILLTLNLIKQKL